jgi:hypothetical protein
MTAGLDIVEERDSNIYKSNDPPGRKRGSRGGQESTEDLESAVRATAELAPSDFRRLHFSKMNSAILKPRRNTDPWCKHVHCTVLGVMVEVVAWILGVVAKLHILVVVLVVVEIVNKPYLHLDETPLSHHRDP